MTKKTSNQLKSIWRQMEAEGAPKADIDKVYSEYWDAIDRERAESQKQCRQIEAENARIAAINRANGKIPTV